MQRFGCSVVVAACIHPASGHGRGVDPAPDGSASVIGRGPTAAASSAAASTSASAPASASASTAVASPGTKFAGVSVNLLTFNGPQVAEPLQRRAPDWEQLTGGHVNVVAVGFQTIYDKALLDASTKTNSFDGYVFDPQWMGDFVGPGLPARPDRSREERSAARPAGHRAVLPDYNSVYDGKTYTIPLDGDFHMVYYRPIS